MDIYLQTENGSYTFNGMTIPNDDANRHYIKMQEDVIAATASITEFVLSLDDAKANRKDYINAERDKACNAGVSYGGNVYDSDKNSRDNLTSVHSGVNDGWILPGDYTWRTADNLDVPFTNIEINGLAHTMLTFINTQLSTSWSKKSDIDAAADIAAVNDIVW